MSRSCIWFAVILFSASFSSKTTGPSNSLSIDVPLNITASFCWIRSETFLVSFSTRIRFLISYAMFPTSCLLDVSNLTFMFLITFRFGFTSTPVCSFPFTVWSKITS